MKKMDISNLEIDDAEDFTSYTDPDNSQIFYTYAQFRDRSTNMVQYGVRVTVYRNKRGGEAEIGKWLEVGEEEFIAVKNMKR
jgi:hypothetical protein